MTTPDGPAPDRIMELATGFQGSKALLSAVELGVFATLATGPLRLEELRGRLGLHPRAARDFLDVLVSLGMLDRGSPDDPAGDPSYRNTVESDLFLDPAKGGYVGGLLEMLNDRLYGFWGSLTLDQKHSLLRRTYDALPEGGAVIVYEALIDDERRVNTFGLLMSLNMLIETPAGFDYTGADCRRWMVEVGFRESYVQHLVGPDSMVVGLR